jgi:hypothetical protein
MVNEPIIHNGFGRTVPGAAWFVAQKPHAAIVSKVTDSVRRSHVALQ